MRILVVEDDELIAESLVKCLTQLRYAVDVAADGETAWDSAEACDYDLLVLDVMLPKLDGINLCRRLRSKGVKSPILLLTAQDSVNSKVTGLDAGADDYLAKPVDLQEFSARVRALLRRGNSTQQPLLQWGNLQLDPSTCKVTYNNQPIRLTPKEYGLLELFLRNPNRVFKSGAIIDHLWSFEEPPTDDTVRAHLKGLRRKLQKGGISSDPIETIYGIGYRLKEAPTKKTQNSELKIQNSQFSLIQEEETQQITKKVWERGQQKLGHRIAVIEQATTALLKDKLDEELINQAYQNAHKLAGSLGMFGFDFGSHLASEIEQLLQVAASLLPEEKFHLSELVLDLRQQLQQAITKSPIPNNFSDNLSLDDYYRLLKKTKEIDALTGVANRRKSIVEFEQFLRSTNKKNSDKTNLKTLCFAVLQIQDLQQINRQYGHEVGDEVLSNFGRLLRHFFQNDIISRWGGAEFVILMYDFTLVSGMQRLEEILETLYTEKSSISNISDFRLNISWGAAEYPQDGNNLEALYKVAISSKG
ncbi:MAG: response regulator [Scytonematopsis contorta HA4267-MV1]|jgi:diguanylate cyclase (GGDEF)-like protein|nr:response regulator [Scytonematopsis contorta HA4267-MV1]